MKNHSVIGGGGLKLHVQETGNPDGKPILFIHGFSQCRLAWNKQMHSDLATDFRLIAMDIRGHGLSEKPRDAYGDSRMWADDVHAVMAALRLDDEGNIHVPGSGDTRTNHDFVLISSHHPCLKFPPN
jgi:non-heme chloroperoxidase